MLTIDRGGAYFRVCQPEWANCGDLSYAKAHGGRRNPKGECGALSLNATVAVAAAQARHQHVGRAIGLFDLRPERRPQLATFDVPMSAVVDAITTAGIAALGLPPTTLLASKPRLGYSKAVSTVRIGGVVFQLFPVDHEPRHVHALYAGTRVIVDLLDDRTVALASRDDCIQPANAKRSDVKRVLRTAQEHFDVLLAAWEKMHP